MDCFLSEEIRDVVIIIDEYQWTLSGVRVDLAQGIQLGEGVQ